MNNTISKLVDKRQDLDQQLVYEHGYNPHEVDAMSPKQKIEAYINSNHIDITADTIIYLVEAAYLVDLS